LVVNLTAQCKASRRSPARTQSSRDGRGVRGRGRRAELHARVHAGKNNLMCGLDRPTTHRPLYQPFDEAASTTRTADYCTRTKGGSAGGLLRERVKLVTPDGGELSTASESTLMLSASGTTR